MKPTSQHLRTLARAHRRSAAGVLLVAALLSGCASEESPLRPAGYVSFDRPAPALSDEQIIEAVTVRTDRLDAVGREVLDTIRNRPDAFFDASPPDEVLNQAESVFQADGRLGELAMMYHEALERNPQALRYRARVARVLAQLGMTDAALEQARRATVEAPEHPDGWYALASVILQTGRPTPETLVEVRTALSSTLRLRPADPAFDGTPVDELRNQLAQVEQLVATMAAEGPAPGPPSTP